MYHVDMQIGELTIPGVFVLGDDEGDEIIIGRNILNKLSITLNGPDRTVRLLDS